MATKTKKVSKKGSARKKPLVPANDPPIVVSGGGGIELKPGGRKPGKNLVEIEFDPAGGPGSGRFKSKVNKDTKITSVTISFPGMAGAPAPVTLSNYEFYTIQVVFNTAP